MSYLSTIMANKIKAKKTRAVFPLMSTGSGKIVSQTIKRKQESLSETEMDDLRLSNIYVKPMPAASHTLNVRIKTISQGQTKLFPSEYE